MGTSDEQAPATVLQRRRRSGSGRRGTARRREADLRWLGLLLCLTSAALMTVLVWWLFG